MAEIITRDSDPIVYHFRLLDQLVRQVEMLAQNSRPLLNGERYLTDKELSQVIKVSRRTLQQWRTDGLVSYVIFSGKTLYKESDIQALFERYYHRSRD